MDKLVSIIIPIYNSQSFLEKCLTSVIKQTYHNFEVLLINDGSTDESRDICDKYSNIDNRIRTYHKSNGGVSSARNFGLEKAQGEYIVFVDSDDICAPNMIEDMVCNMTDQIDYVVSSLTIIDNKFNKKYLEFEIIGEFSKSNYIRLVFKKYNINYITGAPYAKMFRKSIIKNNNLLFDKMNYAEDFTFNCKYLNVITNNVFIINSNVYFYYENNFNSLTQKNYTNFDLEKFWEPRSIVFESFYNVIKFEYSINESLFLYESFILTTIKMICYHEKHKTNAISVLNQFYSILTNSIFFKYVNNDKSLILKLFFRKKFSLVYLKLRLRYLFKIIKKTFTR